MDTKPSIATNSDQIENNAANTEEQVATAHSEWPPSEFKQYKEVCTTVLNLLKQFFPEELLREFVASELVRIYNLPKPDSEEVADQLVQLGIEYLVSIQKDFPEWTARLKVIFEGKYPERSREAWANNRLSQRRYFRKRPEVESPITFVVEQFDPIRDPKELLCMRLAPDLFEAIRLKNGAYSLKATAEVERFLNGEKRAVPRSSLHEPVIYNRPVWRVEAGWEPYNPRWLPRKIMPVRLVSTVDSSLVLAEFIKDLRETFAWEDDGAFANYLAYLVQPTVAHLLLGQMPAHGFFGPTKSGKGYLSNALPSFIYNRPGDSTVFTKKIPSNTYEMEVYLDACRNAIYISFDEIKNATDEELKLIDAFCTQKTVPVRRMRYGYLEVENTFTLALTAVHRNFSDETSGRVALIKLKESRSEKIAEFHKKWSKRGADILKALFDAVNKVDIDFENLPRIPDRRPGFSLMAHVVDKAFGLQVDYRIEASNSDVLDDLCRMYEEKPELGDFKGVWKRYSTRAFTSYMAETYDSKWRRSTAVAIINTALGYSSTRNHPSYKDNGYIAESGRRYHLEVREEGKETKRTFIYIRELSGYPFPKEGGAK